MTSKLYEILQALSYRGLQRNLGKKTLSTDEAHSAILALIKEMLPKKKEYYVSFRDTVGGTLDSWANGFNSAVEMMEDTIKSSTKVKITIQEL